MKKSILIISSIIGTIILLSIRPQLLTVLAWGDNGAYNNGHRRSYTVEEINNGALGATPKSDGENYKNSSNYPGTIVFNSINVSEPIGGDERSFVAARENTGINAGKDNRWTSINDVKVEDGKEYIVRMYVHNNNPNGTDAVAENTRVRFNVPTTSGKEAKINGFITSSNATPSQYVDYVNFTSDTNFHLEYVYGSALMENNGIGANGGIKLSDDIVKSEEAGILIGYDALDGKIPGCYQYASYVSIRVKAVYDYDFTVEKKVRLAGDTDKTWKESVEAKVGDKVEFQIQYKNTSDATQEGVVIKDVLPSNLRYVAGSTKLKNSTYPNVLNITDGDPSDILNTINIGNYAAGANAKIMFTAEVVDENLACGSNTLINWAQVRVGDTVNQDNASVLVYNDKIFRIIFSVLAILILLCLVAIIKLRIKIRHLKHHSSK